MSEAVDVKDGVACRHEDHIIDLKQAVTRIETKIDGLVSFKTDMEARMRSQEKRSWITIGASFVIAFIAPIFGLKFTPPM